MVHHYIVRLVLLAVPERAREYEKRSGAANKVVMIASP